MAVGSMTTSQHPNLDNKIMDRTGNAPCMYCTQDIIHVEFTHHANV